MTNHCQFLFFLETNQAKCIIGFNIFSYIQNVNCSSILIDLYSISRLVFNLFVKLVINKNIVVECWLASCGLFNRREFLEFLNLLFLSDTGGMKLTPAEIFYWIYGFNLVTFVWDFWLAYRQVCIWCYVCLYLNFSIGFIWKRRNDLHM